ncbi:MAG: outer membrane beta-barrel family protein, partial [Muribaculaceae bacterium]|nr:outer membrane beta-barrel family protein [Muribaculaceae bacterium]
VTDHTTDLSSSMMTNQNVPTYPDNSLTLTGFADWNIDSKGKMMSLTYNYFEKRSNSFSDITTIYDLDEKSRLTKDDNNKYDIHSIKLDVTLPFSSFKIETGGAFTKIGNNTELIVSNDVGGIMIQDPAQSNRFIYNEKTAAVYISAEKNFGNSLFGKIGLRYEHTNVHGIQQADDSRHKQNYGHLFPTLNLSWNIPGAGRISADYSMGITRPSFGDLNPFRYYTTVKDYFTGNPNLESILSHNAGLNYSFRGLYTVIYSSWNRNAIGYITRFNNDGLQWTTPVNCLNTIKTGLYASYNRSLFNWWNLNLGGEVFYSNSKSNGEFFRSISDGGWSGKIEMNTSWMLTRNKNLIFNLRCTHFFPYEDGMTKYEGRTLLNCELRYMLLDNRLTLSASLSNPFGWNVTKSSSEFKNYTLSSRINIHSHSLSLRAAYSFGGKKVNNVYRDSKERESQRSY